VPYRTSPSHGPLGPLVREFRWAHTSRMVLISLIFFMPLLALLVLTDDGNRDVPTILGGLLALVAMPAGGVAILVSAYRLRKNYVRIHEHGFAHRWKDAERTMLYDDVTTIKSKIEQRVRNGIPGPITHRHEISAGKRGPLVITHGFEEVDALIGELRRRTAAPILARAREKLESGGTLDFGAVELSQKAGLQYRGNSLPLAEVGRAEIGGGSLSILAKGRAHPWVEVPYSEVENAETLVQLLVSP